MPLVQTLLAHYNESHPFALGLVMRTPPPPEGDKDGMVLKWLQGGSGIFMSQVGVPGGAPAPLRISDAAARAGGARNVCSVVRRGLSALTRRCRTRKSVSECMPNCLLHTLCDCTNPLPSISSVACKLGSVSLLLRAQAAFRAVAQELYGDLCPFDRFNDVTLARCFSTLGVLKVNDDGCHRKSIEEDDPALARQVHNVVSVSHVTTCLGVQDNFSSKRNLPCSIRVAPLPVCHIMVQCGLHAHPCKCAAAHHRLQPTRKACRLLGPCLEAGEFVPVLVWEHSKAPMPDRQGQCQTQGTQVSTDSGRDCMRRQLPMHDRRGFYQTQGALWAPTPRVMRMQAVAIYEGRERDLHYMSSLRDHLAFHHMTNRAQVAEATCVAEWEAGFIEDILPCRSDDQLAAAQQSRLAQLRL